ncbi:hypothetical protein TNCV_4276441 [Trichonephila clavipes]|nr:hypothetical protein TNCV_4276441 [Trichonephila clavipes]
MVQSGLHLGDFPFLPKPLQLSYHVASLYREAPKWTPIRPHKSHYAALLMIPRWQRSLRNPSFRMLRGQVGIQKGTTRGEDFINGAAWWLDGS